MKKSDLALFVAVMVSIGLFSHAYADNSYPYTIKKPVIIEKSAGFTVRELARSPNVSRAEAITQGKRGSSQWERIAVSTVENYPELLHFKWVTSRPPFGEYDKIALHRIVRKRRSARHGALKRKVIFMVPGTWDAGGWSKRTDPAVNTLIYLAVNGYDVFTMAYRTSYLPNMTYEQFDDQGVDIAGTIGWTYGAYTDDIKACVDKLKSITKAKKIFMSGFSRGSFLMFMYASKYQNDLKGLITFDGWIKDFPADTSQAVDEATFNYFVYLLAQGILPTPDDCQGVLCPPPGMMYQLLSEATWEYYDTWQLASVVPLAQTMAGEPLPQEFATISDFVADDAHNKWGDILFSNYYGGYIKKEVLIDIMGEFSRYWPTIQDFEQWQIESWDDVPYFDYDDNIIDLPAIAFLTPFFCPEGICLDNSIPNKTINEDVTIHYLEHYGHMDILFGIDSLMDIKEPLLEWLNAHK